MRLKMRMGDAITFYMGPQDIAGTAGQGVIVDGFPDTGIQGAGIQAYIAGAIQGRHHIG